MIKKFILLLLMIFVTSCSSRQAVVRTTKSVPGKVVAHGTPAVRNPASVATRAKTESAPIAASSGNNNDIVILEATTRVKVTTAMVLAYIEKYKNVAKENMLRTGIPASITLGQAILESGAGTGPLSMQANNHFGIKCHKEWTGPSISYTDDEENECFRKYSEPDESFRDHSFFLTSRPRYAPLFQLEKNDYVAWAKGLKAAGYATDPKYPEKLVGLIERYGLQKVDAEVLGGDFVSATQAIVYNDDEMSRYEVVKGDTLYSISKRFNISIEELKKKNRIPGSSLSLGQRIIVK